MRKHKNYRKLQNRKLLKAIREKVKSRPDLMLEFKAESPDKLSLPQIALRLGKENCVGGENAARAFLLGLLKIESTVKDNTRLFKWIENHQKTYHSSEWKKANSDGFLESYEWRKVRMVAIKKYGARCQCCGATPADGITINVDHIKPRKLFPELALNVDNLQILCGPCNHGKGNWDTTDWRQTAYINNNLYLVAK